MGVNDKGSATPAEAAGSGTCRCSLDDFGPPTILQPKESEVLVVHLRCEELPTLRWELSEDGGTTGTSRYRENQRHNRENGQSDRADARIVMTR